MEAEDEWIRITLKNGNHLFTAHAIGPNLYELPVQVKRAQALSSTAVQFWHEALGHSSPQTWTHTTNRYPDGHLIPPRPQHFFCQTCARSNARNVAPPATNQ